jgi:hypothetical protein
VQEVAEAAGEVDFAADVLGADSDGLDGGFFVGGFAAPNFEKPRIGSDAEEGVEALEEVGGVAEFDAEGLALGLELDDVEVAREGEFRLNERGGGMGRVGGAAIVVGLRVGG